MYLPEMKSCYATYQIHWKFMKVNCGAKAEATKQVDLHGPLTEHGF